MTVPQKPGEAEITYMTAKVSIFDPRFKELIENRAYGTIIMNYNSDIEYNVELVNTPGQFSRTVDTGGVLYKTMIPNLKDLNTLRELCGDALDDEDRIKVVFGHVINPSETDPSKLKSTLSKAKHTA